MTLDNILEEINKAQTIVILTHENPDGDAIGTGLALYNALKLYGKNPEFVVPEFSRVYNFLPGADEIKKEGSLDKYDLAISVDSATSRIIASGDKYFETAKSKVVIDHHGSNTMYGDYNYVNPDAPACSQLLIVILDYFNIDIDKEIGTCILTGIITDTGGFKYPGVTAETFEFVAGLLKKGVNVSSIYKKVLQIRTKANFELVKIATDRLQFLENGKVAFTYITNQDELNVNAENGDHEGLVDIGRDIEGVEVSIFIRETLEKGLKISLRSNEYVNVSDIALLFGGGGHPRAAGCNIKTSIEQCKERILAEVKKLLK